MVEIKIRGMSTEFRETLKVEHKVKIRKQDKYGHTMMECEVDDARNVLDHLLDKGYLVVLREGENKTQMTYGTPLSRDATLDAIAPVQGG